MNVWCVRAHSGAYAEHFRKGGYVGLHYGIDEPYPVGKDREAFADIYRKYHPEVTSNVVLSAQAGQLRRFCEMKSGDYVITPSANTAELFYGVVEGEAEDAYYFVAEPTDDCWYKHRRPVKWSDKSILRSTLSVPFQNTLLASLTVFGVSQMAEFFTAIGEELPPDLAEEASAAVSDVEKGYGSTRPVQDPYDSVLKQILELDPTEFEILVGHLLAAMGFEETEVTPPVGDGGVDVIGTLNMSNLASVRIRVQAKRQQARVTSKVVMDLRGRIKLQEWGAVITTSEFQKAAYEAASEEGFIRIGLINGRQLVDLLVKHWEEIPSDFQDKLGLHLQIEKRLVPAD